MGAVEGGIDIDASPDAVFELCSNFENELRWNPMAEKAVKVTGGAVGVGTTYRAKWKRSPEMDVRCVAFDPAARTWTNHNAGPVEVTSTFAVTATKSGSRLAARFQADGHGIGKLFAPMLIRQMRHNLPKNLERIKLLVEAGPPSGTQRLAE